MTTTLFRLKMAILGLNIRIGEGVTVGRMVRVQVTEGGEIVIGDGVAIQDFVLLCAQEGRIHINDGTFIGMGSQVVAVESVNIGEKCLIAAYSVIRDANHGTAPGRPMADQDLAGASINIGDDVWLGTHVVVTAGSTIGSGAVVGANAVVVGDVPSMSVAVGMPARVIRMRGATIIDESRS